MIRKLFLKLGESSPSSVSGMGVVVVEQRDSQMAGGLCMARVVFSDGKERSFINNLDDHNCCYYAGVRIF